MLHGMQRFNRIYMSSLFDLVRFHLRSSLARPNMAITPTKCTEKLTLGIIANNNTKNLFSNKFSLPNKVEPL